MKRRIFLIAIGEARKGLEPGILMDLLMPIMDGGEAARQPPMQVVAVNSYIFPEKNYSPHKSGCHGISAGQVMYTLVKQ